MLVAVRFSLPVLIILQKQETQRPPTMMNAIRPMMARAATRTTVKKTASSIMTFKPVASPLRYQYTTFRNLHAHNPKATGLTYIALLGAALILSTAWEAKKASEVRHYTSIPRRQLEIGELLYRQQSHRSVDIDVGHGQSQMMLYK